MGGYSGGGYRQLPVTPFQPQQQESPLDAYVRIAQLKGMFQQQQLQGAELQKFQTENQLSQLNLQDEQKWRSVMSDPSWDGTPQDLLKRGMQAGSSSRRQARPTLIPVSALRQKP